MSTELFFSHRDTPSVTDSPPSFQQLTVYAHPDDTILLQVSEEYAGVLSTAFYRLDRRTAVDLLSAISAHLDRGSPGQLARSLSEESDQ